ncbi:MAG: hypothetical protein CMD20_00995 [Flavobacteriales bacterium]|nr:hypothetical protein [Flavobacteriales bacterium]
MAKPSKERIEDLLKQNKLAGEQQGQFKKLYDTLVKNNASAAEFEALLSKILLSIDKIADTADYVQKSFNDTLNENRKIVGSLLKQKKALKGIEGIAGKVQSLRMGEGDASEQALAADLQKLVQQKKLLMLAYQGNDIDMKKSFEILKQIQDTNELIASQEHMLEIASNTKKELGFTGEILGGFDKLLQKAGFGGLGISEAVAETQRLAQAADAVGDKGFNSMATFTGLVKDNLMAALSPMKILELLAGAIIKVFTGLDKSTGALAKQLGTSYDNAKLMKKEFSVIAKDSENLFITTKSLTHSFEVLADRFGVIGGFSAETLRTQTELVKQAGYSEEAASEIAKLSLLTGESSKDITASALGTAKAFNMQNGLLLNEKQLLEEASQLSADIQLSLGNSAEELVLAVATAKKFGMNLEQVDAIAGSLLDFESSIANELEAELLLGKNINLEKARQAALDNDLATVAEEIANQVGSAAEFAEMNRIQQEAIAKSVGLSREDLAKSLQEQEAIAKLGGNAASSQEAYNNMLAEGLTHQQIAKKLGDEQLAGSLKATSVQEKLAQSLEKASELFVNIVTTIQPFINGLAAGVGYLAAFVSKFQGILKIVTALVALEKILQVTQASRLKIYNRFLAAKRMEKSIGGALLKMAGLKNLTLDREIIKEKVKLGLKAAEAALNKTILGSLVLQGIEQTKQIAKKGIALALETARAAASMAAAAAASLGLGIGPILAAIAIGGVAIAAMVAKARKVDDMMSPGSSAGGYGNRILTAPEGSFALNNKDTVIAGTNLGGGSSKTDALLETLVRQNAKKPQISPVGLYSVQ